MCSLTRMVRFWFTVRCLPIHFNSILILLLTDYFIAEQRMFGMNKLSFESGWPVSVFLAVHCFVYLHHIGGCLGNPNTFICVAMADRLCNRE